MGMIDRFAGEYRWLSNFWPSVVTCSMGYEYPTVEHAYQASKTTNPEERAWFVSGLTAGQAKRLGRTVTLRADWDDVRLVVMQNLVREKFTRHAALGAQLVATWSHVLVESNTWGDTYWGVCRGRGTNWLGRILMVLRAELQQPRLL